MKMNKQLSFNKLSNKRLVKISDVEPLSKHMFIQTCVSSQIDLK